MYNLSMLTFKLGRILDYAPFIISKDEFDQALRQFFGQYSLDDFDQPERVMALFNEWFMYEYRNSSNQRLSK